MSIRDCSVLNAINLEKWEVKIHKCALLLGFLLSFPFLVIPHTCLISRISPGNMFVLFEHCKLALKERKMVSFTYDPISGLRQFLSTESCLKMIKNIFYFMLKAFFVLEIFTFLSWFFGYVEKRLDKKVKLMRNFVTSQSEIQIITIYVMTNISRSKGNEVMEFGQLIEYNVKNNFLQKFYTENEVGRLIPEIFLFWKKLKQLGKGKNEGSSP